MAKLTEVPHLKLVTKKIYLDNRMNNVYFLMTSSFDRTEEIIRDNSNMINKNRAIRFFYMPGLYTGRIYNKIYKKNFKKERIQNYRVLVASGIRGISALPYDQQFFYGMYHHITIFNDMIEKHKVNINNTIKLFWQYYTAIFNSIDSLNTHQRKVILINANDYKKFGTSVDENKQNPLFILWYTLKRRFDLIDNIDIDIYIYTDTKVLYINPSKCNGSSDAMRFLNQVQLLYKSVSNNDIASFDEKKVTVEDNIANAIETNKKSKGNTTSTQNIIATVEKETVTDEDIVITNEIDSISEDEIESITNTIDEELYKKLKDVFTEAPDTPIKDAIALAKKRINEDEEALHKIYKQMEYMKMPSKPVLSKRDEQLKEEQKRITIKGTTVEELEKINPATIVIPTANVSNQTFNSNKDADEIKFSNFDKAYVDNLLPKDIMDCFLSLNNKSIPMHIRDVTVTDTSNELNYKESWRVSLEDINRKRHTLEIDIPKIIDGKFMYIGGNKKTILKQKYFYPVVKTNENEVQIVTNYNKYFIYRSDANFSSVKSLLTFLQKNQDAMAYFKFGDVSSNNSDSITTIEYDQLSKNITSYQTDSCLILFDQSEALKYASDHKVKIPANHLFIGISDNKPILINTDTQQTKDGDTIVSIIIKHFPEEIKTAFNKRQFTAVNNASTAKIRTMEQLIPVSVLLCYYEGFSSFLEKSKLEYRIVDVVRGKKPEISPNEAVLTFKDVYFIYKATPYAILLLSGLVVLHLESYELSIMDTTEPYIPYLLKVYGNMNVLNSLLNAYEWTIDPITEEVLTDCNYPTTYSSLLLYAVKLLLDNQYQPEMEQRLSRIRCMEVIPAMLYWCLARHYTNFRNSAGRKKYTVPKDSVMKGLLALKTVEDTSVLNPVLELERTYTASQKGFRGINLDEYYTMSKRTYSPSMIGIFGESSSPDKQVGVSVSLTLEPSVTNLRGYCDVKGDTEKINELKNVNLLSPGELLIPFSGSHDDATRVGHAIKQSKHVVPIAKGSPALITNGVDETCRFYLSSDYIVNAEDDGKVIEYDDKLKIMIVEYKNGSHRAINLSSTIVKNGGGGFSMTNILTTDLHLGSKFKKGDCLAWHKDFFHKSPITNTVRYNIGKLAKVALMSTYNTFQDTTFISSKASEDMTTEMTFPFHVVVGKNANVEFIAKEGDHVEVGDSLIRFDTSFEDPELNKLLDILSNDERLRDDVLADTKNDIKSKYAGVIEKIEVYATVDLDEMSDSLRKIVNSHYNTIKRKKKLLDNYDKTSSVYKCGMLLTDPTTKIDTNRFGVIKGNSVTDSVLFIFNIRHGEILEVASKIANYSGLKNTIGEIIPKGQEGFSTLRPEENIDSIIASNSILKRKTPSIILVTCANKTVVEWKRALLSIYNK